MVGAHESYLKAVVNNPWSGFACLLHDTRSKAEILQCLENSQRDWLLYLDEYGLKETQRAFLLDLLEHEVQHHGQWIRYVDGNRLNFPASRHDR